MRHIAARIIADEHRAMRSVLGALQHVTRELIDGNRIDLELVDDILRYVEEFPRRVHHPKEDAFLFSKLRTRTRELDGLVAVLERDHEEEEAMLREIRSEFAELGSRGKKAASFGRLVDEYAGFMLRHIAVEENVVIPLSEKKLTEQDWEEIDAAFARSEDPLSGRTTDEHYLRLRELIATASRKVAVSN